MDLYKSIYETRDIEKTTAEKIVVEVKQRYDSLDKKKLFQEQSALISKINRTLSSKVYGNFVPNYKTIASVYSIFQNGLPVKDRVLLEQSIVNEMSASIEAQANTNQQPIDSLTYRTFVNKFNQEYSDLLSESQKKLLSKYISSFADNGLELKVFLNEEVGQLKAKIIEYKESNEVLNDISLKEKFEKVYNILEGIRDKHIDTEMIEIVLSAQQMVEELEEIEADVN